MPDTEQTLFVIMYTWWDSDYQRMRISNAVSKIPKNSAFWADDGQPFPNRVTERLQATRSEPSKVKSAR